MNKIYDVCLAKKNTKGEYLKTKEGKSVYENWGTVFKDEKDHLSLVLKTINGDVWFSLFEIRDKDSIQKKDTPVETLDEVPF